MYRPAVGAVYRVILLSAPLCAVSVVEAYVEETVEFVPEALVIPIAAMCKLYCIAVPPLEEYALVY